jgi:hypothetical protein
MPKHKFSKNVCPENIRSVYQKTTNVKLLICITYYSACNKSLEFLVTERKPLSN